MSKKYMNRKPKKGAITRSEKKVQRAEAAGIVQRNPKNPRMVLVPGVMPITWTEVYQGETEEQAILRYMTKIIK